jgi:hypothetical protein
MKVPLDTWGALFYARPQPEGLATDRQEILDRGFTILGERAFAGRVQICGHGRTAAVDGVITDFDFKLRVHSFFFKLTAGDDLTLSLIQNWTDVDSVLK